MGQSTHAEWYLLETTENTKLALPVLCPWAIYLPSQFCTIEHIWQNWQVDIGTSSIVQPVWGNEDCLRLGGVRSSSGRTYCRGQLPLVFFQGARVARLSLLAECASWIATYLVRMDILMMEIQILLRYPHYFWFLYNVSGDVTIIVSSIIKVNVQSPTLTSFSLQCTLVWKRCRDGTMYIYLHVYIIPTLFACSLACHPYIILLYSCNTCWHCTTLGSVKHNNMTLKLWHHTVSQYLVWIVQYSC